MRNRQTTCTLISEQHDIKIPSINCTILSCIWSYHIPHCRWNSVCCGSCRIHLENHHRSISTYKFWCSGTSLRSGQHAYVASSLIDCPETKERSGRENLALERGNEVPWNEEKRSALERRETKCPGTRKRSGRGYSRRAQKTTKRCKFCAKPCSDWLGFLPFKCSDWLGFLPLKI